MNANAATPTDHVRMLHELQADTDYLVGRIAADGSCSPMIAASIKGKLAAIEVGFAAEIASLRAEVAGLRASELAWKLIAKQNKRWIELPHGERPDWNAVMADCGGANADDNDLVMVTRGSARLAQSALRAANAADYYHNSGAAEREFALLLDCSASLPAPAPGEGGPQ